MLQHRIAACADLAHVVVDSAGTSGEHDGEAPDARTCTVLERHGIKRWSRSRRVRADDFDAFDLIFAMDAANIAALTRMAGGWGKKSQLAKVSLAGALDGSGTVPDPWYGELDGFNALYRQLDSILEVLVQKLVEEQPK